jgi:hypothetical protein
MTVSHEASTALDQAAEAVKNRQPRESRDAYHRCPGR